MKYFSMFSGIGGFELGIKKSTTGEWDCIGFSEIDKHAIQIYKQHFPEHKNYGDATRIIPEELPDFDLLCGGFPCQSFSIAGKRKGFEDTRGTLFFEICRIARAKRPSYLFLENVRGLLSHDNGYTFLVILESLAELGYSLQWQVLNSKDFGVPQNRERVFIIGHLAKASPPKVFPIKETNRILQKCCIPTRQKSIKKCNKEQDLRNFKKRRRGSIIKRQFGKHQQDCVINPEGISPCLASNTTFDKWDIEIKEKVRRLTPIECERLQGFPDGWTEGVSDTQRYKCLGNAVTVNVIEVIMTRWLNYSFSKNV